MDVDSVVCSGLCFPYYMWLNGFVNKKSGPFWVSKSLPSIPKRPLRVKKINLWLWLVSWKYHFWKFKWYWSYHWRTWQTMIADFLWHKSDDIDLNDRWFEQDSATNRLTRPVLSFLHEKFLFDVWCVLTTKIERFLATGFFSLCTYAQRWVFYEQSSNAWRLENERPSSCDRAMVRYVQTSQPKLHQHDRLL